jgi:hypothetical protein
MSFRRVIEEPFSTLPDGRRVLQCHSRGDKRFSPFCCFVKAFGRQRSIEDHYQSAKVFEWGQQARNWSEAKQLKHMGFTQTWWRIGRVRVRPRSNDAKTGFALDDLGIQFYIALWFKFLHANPELIQIASQFDEFEDPFRGTFPFCQADVIRQCVREGLGSLKPMFSELDRILRT